MVKSVFNENSPTGRDPFHPTSRRRGRAQAALGSVGEAIQSNALLSQLSLKGIAINKRGRFALVNGVTLAPGEQAELRCGTQLARIQCVEVRDRSVVISIDGLNGLKELRLKEGI